MLRHKRNVILLLILWSVSLNRPVLSQQVVQDANATRARKISELRQSIKDPTSGEEFKIQQDKTGHVRSIYTPFGLGIEVPGVDKTKPDNVGKEFLRLWKDTLVNLSENNNFVVSKSHKSNQQTHLIYDQYYSNIKVFGGHINIEVDENSRVKSVLANLMKDTKKFDNRQLKLVPSITKDDAKRLSIAIFSKMAKLDVSSLTTVSDQELMIFDPTLFNMAGEPRLAWKSVVKIDLQEPILEKVFIDAHDGSLITKYSLICTLKNRLIKCEGSTVRAEGQAPVNFAEFDYAYLVFGDLYDYYYNMNYRDSYNNTGGQIVADIVEFWDNACWDPDTNTMTFGMGLVTDDVMAHEFTHGVTQYMSGLEYYGESGGINEAFSDMWGEWFDMTHNYSSPVNDQDGPAFDWKCGEDVYGGPIRDLKNPPAIASCPDRYNGPLWNSGSDVHYLSGVGNKLCYLITNGDTFNGLTIAGIGIDQAERLFYAVQQHLVPSSGYYDLYSNLMHVAGPNHLNLSETQKQSIEKACQAVNIRAVGNVAMRLKNSLGETVAIFYDSGRLSLRGTVRTQSTLSPPADAYIIKDYYGTPVAYIDLGTGSEKGKMYVKGTINRHSIPQESSNNAFIIRYQNASDAGIPVLTIDNSGNLKTWNDIVESAVLN